MSELGAAMKKRALRVRPTEAIEEHFRKALGHYVRTQILWILNERVASATEIAEALSEPLNRVGNHLKVLREAGCIEIVKRVVVGNTLQRFYRASARIFLDDTEWPKVPPTIQQGLRITLLQNLMDDAVEAVASGEYDARENSHMSWTPMIIDKQGHQDLIRILDRSMQEVLAVQEEADQRLCSADTEGISYSVSMLGYPSIGGMRKVDPAQGAEEVPELTQRRKATRKRKRSPKKAASGGSPQDAGSAAS